MSIARTLRPIYDDSNCFAMLRRAIKVFGEPAQWGQVIEECAELIVAIKHRDRDRAAPADVAEEVADVLLTALAAREMIGKDMVDSIMEMKLDRLNRRLDHEEARRVDGLEPQGDTGEIK